MFSVIQVAQDDFHLALLFLRYQVQFYDQNDSDRLPLLHIKKYSVIKDSLASVELILAQVKFGPQPPLPLSSQSSSSTSLATKSGIELSNVAPTTEMAPSPHAPSKTSSNPLPIPKFTNEVAALSYLCRHAHKHLSSTKYSSSKAHLSRNYLMHLLSRLISWSMFHEAKSLHQAMETSQDFPALASATNFFESLSSASLVKRLVSAARQFEEKHGFVPDEFVMASFEPFLTAQDHEGLEQIYLALRHPSTAASNLYLKSLLQTRQALPARNIFHQLLQEHVQSKKRLGADAYTFAIYMQHYDMVGDVKQMMNIMELLLSKRYVAPKRIHFELIFKSLLNGHRTRAIADMIEEMSKVDVKELSEAVAAEVVWAMVDSGEYTYGARLHLMLRNTDEFTSLRYFKGVKLCLTSTALLPDAELATVESAIKRLQATPSEPATSRASGINQPKATHSEEKHAKALQQFLASIDKTSPLNVSELQKHLSHSLSYSSLLRIWIVLQENHPTEIPRELTEQLISKAETTDQLKLALNHIQEAKVPPSTRIWTHHMRYLALTSANMLSTSIKPEKLHKEIGRIYNQYAQVPGLTPNWEVQKWRLRALYHLQRGDEALSLLEELLPTVAELMNAPASVFSLEGVKSVQPSKITIKRRKSKGTFQEPPVVENEDPSHTEKFRLPSTIAADFYTFSALLEPSATERQRISKEAEAMASLPSAYTLSSSELRILLSAVQLARRRPQTVPTTKNGWKSRYNNQKPL